MSCLTDTKTPGWRSLLQMTRHELPRFWELAMKKWEQMDPGTEDQLYLKPPRWCWSDHWWPIWRWLLEMTVLFLHVAPLPLLSIKALTSLFGLGWGQRVVGRQSAFEQTSATLSSVVASIWNKANFPFHQPGLFIDFRAASSQTHHMPFGNRICSQSQES